VEEFESEKSKRVKADGRIFERVLVLGQKEGCYEL
jgi:hypothetical protein